MMRDRALLEAREPPIYQIYQIYQSTDRVLGLVDLGLTFPGSRSTKPQKNLKSTKKNSVSTAPEPTAESKLRYTVGYKHG
jgi:hypothetical protein